MRKVERLLRPVLALLLLHGAAPEVRAHEEVWHRIEALSARLAAGSGSAGAPAELYLRRADLYRQARSWSAALADLEGAERLDPRLSGVDFVRALTLFDAERPAEALAAIDRSLGRRPGAAADRILRASILVRLGRPLDAAADFTRGIDSGDPSVPPSPDLYLERARALATDPRHLVEAIRGLDEGIDRLGPVPGLRLLADELERRAGRREVAPERAARRSSSARPGGRAAAPGGDPSTASRDSGAAGVAGAAEASKTAGKTEGFSAASVALRRGPYLQMGTPTGVVVRWRTGGATDSQVRYGTSATALDRTADVAGTRLDHAVTLSGLEPGTRYFYSVGSGAEVLAGADGSLSFVTSPREGAAKPTRIWVLGDSGTANADAAAVRNAYTAYSGGLPPDLWLMLGDNAYDTGTDAEYQAAVFDMYPAQLRSSVLWPTLGNHDAFNPSVYFSAFTLPTAGEAGGVPSGTESYYSFDYGELHFVCLDSQVSDRSPQGAMMTWLRADLERNRLPWVIAFWHHPPYSKGSHDSDTEVNLVEMRQFANPILEAGGVDLVLSGHSHSYERSFLLDRHYGPSGSLVPGMVLDGGDGRPAGNGAYEKGTGPHQGAVYAVAGSSGRVSVLAHHPAMFVGLAALGSLVLDLKGDRLEATFLRENGSIGDSFTLHKEIEAPPVPTTVTFGSVAAQDGFVSELSEESGTGGSATATLGAGAALRIGDLSRDRQLRSIVSFDTSALPDGATILEARLRLVRGALAGTDPFTTHGRCRIEVRRGVFGGARALAPGDFSAPATLADAGTLAAPGANGLAEAILNAEGLAALHKAGTTQLRLSFTRDDDEDGRADYAGFFSGESAASLRPQLVVTYR